MTVNMGTWYEARTWSANSRISSEGLLVCPAVVVTGPGGSVDISWYCPCCCCLAAMERTTLIIRLHEYEQHLNIMINVIIDIKNNTKYFTIPTSHLKFCSEAMVFNLHFAPLVVNNFWDEGLDSKLEIAGGENNVSPDVLMNARVLLKEILNRFSIYLALLEPSIVDIGDIMIP